ncbi:MAG: hypothetical protein JXA94_06995, partial [Parachlamydiales bacterium]|nr:hypothetical protein [Parachlamydiales bacterium]
KNCKLMKDFDISKKTSLVLKIVLMLFLLILFKVWLLTIIQKEEKLKDSKKPKSRTIVQKATRGIITDRDGNALAANRIKYNATIYYSHIRQLPYCKYVLDENNRKVKKYIRKDYISDLSELLSNELNLDKKRIEDTIHSKASVMPHIPYIIKENISEEKYYKLKLLQRDWPGLNAEITSERYYPSKEVAAPILGYMGAINEKEYLKIADEIKTYQNFIEKYENKEEVHLQGFETIDDVKNALTKLKKLSYSSSDLIGKAGIEKRFEQKLKGFHEKKTYLVDILGNFLKEVEDFKKPMAGQEIKLAISLELQTFAEKLLMQDEKIRDGSSQVYKVKNKQKVSQKQPFLKGGSIVVMDPNTGEILAMASYPRYDPNNFILSSNSKINEKKKKNICKWLEDSSHIANIFDGKEKLSREIFDNKIIVEEVELTFEKFLDFILPIESPLISAINNIKTVNRAISLQEDVETLLYFAKTKSVISLFDAIFTSEASKKRSNQNIDEIQKNLQNSYEDIKFCKNNVSKFLKNIPDNFDKIFLIDILRMAVHSPAFSDDLIKKIDFLTLKDYWNITKATLRLKDLLKSHLKPVFHDEFFTKWRHENEKDFLIEKRKIEKAKKRYAKPFIDYLDNEEERLFSEFWEKYQNVFIVYLIKENVIKNSEIIPYIKSIVSIDKHEIQSDLDLLKNSTLLLDDTMCFSFVKTIRSFYELDRPLLHKYSKLTKSGSELLEKDLAKSFYPKNGFGYSRSYAINSASPPGSIFKIIPAYAALKERYEFLKQNNLSLNRLNPFTMIDDIYWDSKVKKGGSLVVGKSLDGKPYPRIYKKGRLPRSAHAGIGQIDLTRALEQSSNPYFSILSSDCISNPYNLINAAKDFSLGEKTQIDLFEEKKGNLPEDIIFNKTSLYSFAIGQHSLIVTPLQAAVAFSAIANSGKVLKPKLLKDEKTTILKQLFMPDEIRNMILDGLDKVVSSEKGSARPIIIKKLLKDRKLMDEYKSLKHQFVGKTSTAEFMYNPSTNPSSKAEKYKNIWFAAISFEKPSFEITEYNKKNLWDKPEIVVIVELNFADGGKEAAPLAFQIIKKYREIKEKKPLE